MPYSPLLSLKSLSNRPSTFPNFNHLTRRSLTYFGLFHWSSAQLTQPNQRFILPTIILAKPARCTKHPSHLSRPSHHISSHRISAQLTPAKPTPHPATTILAKPAQCNAHRCSARQNPMQVWKRQIGRMLRVRMEELLLEEWSIAMVVTMSEISGSCCSMAGGSFLRIRWCNVDQ